MIDEKKLNASTTIEEMWAQYSAAAIPEQAGVTQRRDVRKAFYTGAASMFHLIMRAVDESHKTGDDDVMPKRIDVLSEELKAFTVEMLSEKLNAIIDGALAEHKDKR